MSENLPTLSLDALEKIKQIERYARSCRISDIGNTSAAKRDIRSCATAMFEVYWRDFGPLDDSFVTQVKREIAGCLSATFTLALDESVAAIEVLDALDKHIGMLWPGGLSPTPVPELADRTKLKEHMESTAAIIGIKAFCAGASISEASYHKMHHGTAKQKVRSKVESYLNSTELQNTLKNSK